VIGVINFPFEFTSGWFLLSLSIIIIDRSSYADTIEKGQRISLSILCQRTSSTNSLTHSHTSHHTQSYQHHQVNMSKSGLCNIGNTCYTNAVLRCLHNTKHECSTSMSAQHEAPFGLLPLRHLPHRGTARSRQQPSRRESCSRVWAPHDSDEDRYPHHQSQNIQEGDWRVSSGLFWQHARGRTRAFVLHFGLPA
jgi:hypothetical protein